MKRNFERKIRGYFMPIRSVLAVYGFGSRVSGRFSPASDVDLAVFLAPGARRKAFELQIEWSEDLSRVLGLEVDVVILNDADPFLRFQVYSTGRSLWIRDEGKAGDFKWRSIREYWDWRPTQRLLEGRGARLLGEHGRR